MFLLDKFLLIYFFKEGKRKFILKALLFTAIFCIPSVYGILKYGSWITEEYNNQMEMISVFLQFIVFKLPISLVLISIIVKDRIRNFLIDFKYYGIILAPFCFWYIIRMLIGENRADNFYLSVGNMSYMAIANICVVTMMGISLSFIYYENKIKWEIISGICIFVLWLSALYSGTRSIFIVGLFFSSIILVWKLIFDKRLSIKKVGIVAGIIILTTVFSFLVWAPENSGVVKRMENFIYEKDSRSEEITMQGQLSEERGNEIEQIYINYIVEQEQPYSESLKQIRSDIKMEEGSIVQLNDSENKDILLKYNIHFNRIALWNFAFNEFEKKPVLGNGIMYFQNKYVGYYPHCILLELLVDTGIIGTSVFVLAMIYLLIKCVKVAKYNKDRMCLVILGISFAPVYMLSTGLYIDNMLVYTIWAMMFMVLNEREHINDINCCSGLSR